MSILESTGASLSSPLVLVDVGASLEVHADFLPLEGFSVVVAFDADERELPKTTSTQRKLVNKAVVSADAITDGHAFFTLTQNPTLSSTLDPDATVAGKYSLARRLDPIRRIQVPATTLAQAMEDQGLDRIDWLKLDTQGTDGRLVGSLPQHMADQLMCVDVEPGIDAFYHGEDTFDAVHGLMRSSGFWLASLQSIDAARISRDAFGAILPRSTSFLQTAVDVSLSGRYKSPVAVNARYMRDPQRAQSAAGAEGLKRLWICAMASRLLPFAFEVARLFNEVEHSAESEQLLAATGALLRRRLLSPLLLARKVTLGRIRRALVSHF